MRKLSGAVLSAVVLGLISSAVGAPRHPATVKVKVGDDFFSVRRLTIKRGSTVKWVWPSGGTNDPHTVSDASDRWSSQEMTSGSYTHRFTKAGSYLILCRVHPDQMRIKVTVRR
jgi:plastocyanin